MHFGCIVWLWAGAWSLSGAECHLCTHVKHFRHCPLYYILVLCIIASFIEEKNQEPLYKVSDVMKINYFLSYPTYRSSPPLAPGEKKSCRRACHTHTHTHTQFVKYSPFLLLTRMMYVTTTPVQTWQSPCSTSPEGSRDYSIEGGEKTV